MTVPPPLMLTVERILPVIPRSETILFSSSFNCMVSKWENFEFFMPSIRYCLALIPSLAATRGFACAGGFMSTEA